MDLYSLVPGYRWEASDALHKRLSQAGLVRLQGRPGGWSEMYRVFKECKVGVRLPSCVQKLIFSSLVRRG